jgi:lantibiotic modifying enzyme
MPVWRTFGPGLYEGTAGIALFLARLYAATGDVKHAMTAIGCMRQALSLESTIPSESALSFYSGTLGIVYVADALAELCTHPDISGETNRLLRGLIEIDPATQESDVISGLAGAIPALLALAYRQGPLSQALRDFAVRLGDALLTRARRHEGMAWSWPAQAFVGGHDLVGYSHGTAGIACAFLELLALTGEARFREAAFGALVYERGWYDANERNWPDLRSTGEGEAAPPSYPAFWCHGAAGIGFARLRCFALAREQMWEEAATDFWQEAQIALNTTARVVDMFLEPGRDTPIDLNFSLCHGLAGNADLFLYAEEILGQGEDVHALVRRARAVGELGIVRHVSAGTRAPWPCGVPGAGETPGLMLGLAGIGHLYLRLADPAATPTPLIIKPGRSGPK